MDLTFRIRFLSVPSPRDRGAVCHPSWPPSRAAFPGHPIGSPFRAYLSGPPFGVSSRCTSFPAFLAVCLPGLSFRSALPGNPLRAALAGLPVERASSRPGLSPLVRSLHRLSLLLSDPRSFATFRYFRFGPGFRSASAFRFQRRLPPWGFSRPFIARLMKQIYTVPHP
jgi:hypothetical protein